MKWALLALAVATFLAWLWCAYDETRANRTRARRAAELASAEVDRLDS